MAKKKRRRFKIPKSITISGKRWKVCIEPETSKYRKLDADNLTLAEERCLGMCYRKPIREIHLARELKGRQLEKTFVHEILHACMPTQPVLTYEQEERIVEELSGPLAGVIGNMVLKRKRGR